MLRLEEEKKKKMPMDQFQKEKLQKRNNISQRAVQVAHEQLDEVK